MCNFLCSILLPNMSSSLLNIKIIKLPTKNEGWTFWTQNVSCSPVGGLSRHRSLTLLCLVISLRGLLKSLAVNYLPHLLHLWSIQGSGLWSIRSLFQRSRTLPQRNIAKTSLCVKVFKSFLSEWLMPIVETFLDPCQYGLKGAVISQYLLHLLMII